MHPENITLTNPLISHSDLRQLVDEMLEAVTPFLKKMKAELISQTSLRTTVNASQVWKHSPDYFGASHRYWQVSIHPKIC